MRLLQLFLTVTLLGITILGVACGPKDKDRVDLTGSKYNGTATTTKPVKFKLHYNNQSSEKQIMVYQGNGPEAVVDKLEAEFDGSGGANNFRAVKDIWNSAKVKFYYQNLNQVDKAEVWIDGESYQRLMFTENGAQIVDGLYMLPM